MASLVNSLRNIASDPWWFVKIALFSAVIFYILYSSYDYQAVTPDLAVIYIVITVLFLGCAAVSMHRNINNKTPFFPGLFSIGEVLIKAIGASAAILPGFLLYYCCMTFVYKYVVLEPFVMGVIYLFVTLFFSPFVFVPAVLYSVNGRLTDAFNFGIIFNSSGNFTVQFLSYIIQYALIFVTMTLCVYFFILEMLGDNVGLLILKCVAIVLTFFSIFSYCSDLYGDVIPEIKEKKKSKPLRRMNSKNR